MAYNGTIDLISGIRQVNGRDFPLVDASAVRIDDNTRLDDVLNADISDILRNFTIDVNGYICQIMEV